MILRGLRPKTFIQANSLSYTATLRVVTGFVSYTTPKRKEDEQTTT